MLKGRGVKRCRNYEDTIKRKKTRCWSCTLIMWLLQINLSATPLTPLTIICMQNRDTPILFITLKNPGLVCDLLCYVTQCNNRCSPLHNIEGNISTLRNMVTIVTLFSCTLFFLTLRLMNILEHWMNESYCNKSCVRGRLSLLTDARNWMTTWLWIRFVLCENGALTAATTIISAFYSMLPYSLIGRCQYFIVTSFLNFLA
jgi:hypothetical protein